MFSRCPILSYFLTTDVCPFTVRLAWHASGTYDDSDKTGGSDGCGKGGASMRFDPEINWGANAGLSLMQDIIKPVKDKFPELRYVAKDAPRANPVNLHGFLETMHSHLFLC